jgi:hypothetical protein
VIDTLDALASATCVNEWHRASLRRDVLKAHMFVAALARLATTELSADHVEGATYFSMRAIERARGIAHA